MMKEAVIENENGHHWTVDPGGVPSAAEVAGVASDTGAAAVSVDIAL